MVLRLPLRPSVLPLLSLVDTMATTPSKYLRMVAATLLNGLSRERRAQLIDSASFSRTTPSWRRPRMSARTVLEQVGPIQAPVGPLDSRESLVLDGRQVPVGLAQRAAGLLEALTF